MWKFDGKKHARVANNKLRLDGRATEARRHLADTVEAERVYERIVRETTKHTIKADKAAEIAEKLTHRRNTTRQLAGALEQAGRQVLFADDMETALRERRPFRPRVSIRMPGDKPGEELVYNVTNTRRVNFFPEIAAQKHAAMVKDLTAFVQRQRPGSICMMTFNAGTRWREGARVDKLREGRRELRGALCKLFKLPAFLEWFEPLLIGEEFGTPKARYSRLHNAWSWHLHTHGHTLLRFRRHIPDFNRLMQWVRLKYHSYLRKTKFPGLCRLLDFEKPLAADFKEKVKGWLADTGATPLVEYDGALKHEEEACKYPFKDKDMDAILADGGPSVVCALYENLFRARLCTPLNSFRAFRREHYQRDGLRHKFVAEKTPGGDTVLQPVNDWNCQTPNTAEAILERKRRANSLGEIKRTKEAETREYRRILKARLAEFEGIAKTGESFMESFPRNDFRIEGVSYNYLLPISALKREITWLFARLISSSVLFDTAIPAFVLEEFGRFPAHVKKQQAIFEIAHAENGERKPVVNLVVARIAPSFLGGGTIARPGIVVIGATDDGRVWRQNPLARRVESVARPLIAEAVAQRDYEAALPDFAPPIQRAGAGAHAAGLGGSSQTPLNFQFSGAAASAAPPG